MAAQHSDRLVRPNDEREGDVQRESNLTIVGYELEYAWELECEDQP